MPSHISLTLFTVNIEKQYFGILTKDRKSPQKMLMMSPLTLGNCDWLNIDQQNNNRCRLRGYNLVLLQFIECSYQRLDKSQGDARIQRPISERWKFNAWVACVCTASPSVLFLISPGHVGKGLGLGRKNYAAKMYDISGAVLNGPRKPLYWLYILHGNTSVKEINR